MVALRKPPGSDRASMASDGTGLDGTGLDDAASDDAAEALAPPVAPVAARAAAVAPKANRLRLSMRAPQFCAGGLMWVVTCDGVGEAPGRRTWRVGVCRGSACLVRPLLRGRSAVDDQVSADDETGLG